MDVFTAIKRRDHAAVSRLLDRGTPADTTDNQSNSLAFLAVEAGSASILELLLDRGASPHAEDNNDRSLFNEALRQQDEESVELLLAAGVDPHERGAHGQTGLHSVAAAADKEGSRLRLLERCLQQGLDPTVENAHGQSPLHLAVRWNQTAPVARLLEAGCKIDAESRRPTRTPLAIAVSNGATATAELLIDTGADIDHPSLEFAIKAVVDRPTVFEMLDLLRRHAGPSELLDQAEAVGAANLGDTVRLAAFLESGVNPSTPLFVISALMNTIYQSDVDCLRLLLKAGASVEEPEWLLKAALENELDDDGFLEGVELLIRAGVDVDSVVEPKYQPMTTALGFCVRRDLDDAFNLLLEAGADPKRAPEYGESALWWAAASARWRFLDRIKPNWRDDPSLLDAQVIGYASNGSIEELRKVLSLGGDPNAAEFHGGSALMRAAHEDHPECVEVLLAAGADPNWNANINGDTAAQRASFRCRTIIQRFVSPDTPTEADLIDAVERDDLALAKRCLDAGVKPNAARVEPAETPLMVAARLGSTDVVDALLEAGVSPDRDAGVSLKPSFNHAVEAGQVEIVKRFLAAGADPQRAMLEACTNPDPTKLETLLAAGVDSDLGTERSRPLLLAVARGSCRSVELLLEHGADPHAVMVEQCFTPLSRAAVRGHDDMVSVLLDHQANPDRPGEPEWTPLMVAAQRGDPDLVELLTLSGADPSAIHQTGTTAFVLAVESGHPSVAKHIATGIEDFDEESRRLIGATLDGDALTIKELTDKGHAVDGVEPCSLTTALHAAAAIGHEHAVEALIEVGASLEARDHLGRPPLLCAAAACRPDAVFRLAEAGAAVDATDVDGRTALHLAVEGSIRPIINAARKALGRSSVDDDLPHTPITATVERLLDAGAEIGATDRRGVTALHLAAAIGHRELVDLLLSRGADAGATDASDRKPGDVVSTREHNDTLPKSTNDAPVSDPEEDESDEDNDAPRSLSERDRYPNDLELMLDLAVPTWRRLPLGYAKCAIAAMAEELRSRAVHGDMDAVEGYAGLGATLFSFLMEAPTGFVNDFPERAESRESMELMASWIRLTQRFDY